MKKRILAIVCIAVLLLGALAGCNKGETPAAGGGDSNSGSGSGAAASSDTASTEGVQASPEFYASADLSVLNGKKIGVTIQSLQNAYWAGVMAALEDVLKANGANPTIVA